MSFFKNSNIAMPVTMFLFKITFLFSLQKGHTGVYDRERCEIWICNDLGTFFWVGYNVTTLLLRTFSRILPKTEFKMSLKIFSAFVLPQIVY